MLGTSRLTMILDKYCSLDEWLNLWFVVPQVTFSVGDWKKEEQSYLTNRYIYQSSFQHLLCIAKHLESLQYIIQINETEVHLVHFFFKLTAGVMLSYLLSLVSFSNPPGKTIQTSFLITYSQHSFSHCFIQIPISQAFNFLGSV